MRDLAWLALASLGLGLSLSLSRCVCLVAGVLASLLPCPLVALCVVLFVSVFECVMVERPLRLRGGLWSP